MAHVPTVGGIKACFRYKQAEQAVCNVLHFKGPDNPTTDDLRDLAELLIDWWVLNLKPLINTAITLEAIEVTDISTDGGEGIIYTNTLPQAGTAGFNPLPNNVTLAVSFRTGLTGRSNRGRAYQIGISDANLAADQQHITPAFQTLLKNAWDALLSTMSGSGYVWSVLSTITGGAPRLAGVLTPIINTLVETTLDSMRRRLPGRGN